MGGRASGPILCSLLRWRKLSKKGVTRPNMAFIALLYLRTLDRPGKSLPKCLPLCAEQIYIFANEMANYLRKTKWRNPFFVILSGRFLHWPLLKFVNRWFINNNGGSKKLHPDVWNLSSPQKKLKRMLMQNSEGTTKSIMLFLKNNFLFILSCFICFFYRLPRIISQKLFCWGKMSQVWTDTHKVCFLLLVLIHFGSNYSF